MQFVYHEYAGKPTLLLETKAYEHIFKVRRMGIGERLCWRNLEDDFVYWYEISNIGKKEATLTLLSKEILALLPSNILHIGWSVIDPKIIEKTLPMLNELGVSKITFFYAEFSQKNHKLDFERMKRILINSSQQCGRSKWMEIEILPTLQSYLEHYSKSYVLDFSEIKLKEHELVESILIGPEGGFSEKERILLQNQPTVGLTCKTILRSETAVVAVASKILA
ncbi:MAG: 16S rRNA (uracil(1498)-N(3))-methyltransferase [Epsilonproteobacteria bacterium]|nr:16S rRNA (uracil(1498)-N(3))-methyltransferase [Campylobacterota bacterium]